MINPIIFTRTRTVHCHRRRAFEVLTTRTTITQAQPRGSGRRCHLRTASVATGILHCLRFAYGLGTGILNYDDAEQVAAESWSNPSGEIPVSRRPPDRAIGLLSCPAVDLLDSYDSPAK
jgi:hypothetical protein